MINYDENMTYWQSLRIVVSAMLTSAPMRMDDVDEICEGMKMIMWASFGVLIRIIVLVTLPISALLLAWTVQIERKRIAKQMKDADDDI